MHDALPLSDSVIPGAPPEFNVQELLNVATRARGKTCHRGPNDSGRGQFSFTVPISFDDGVEWIAKCPQTNAVKLPEVRRLMLESEVATLQLVRERTTIPVPQVFAWSSSDENPVGSAYIVMSRASGRLLSDCGWYSWLSADGSESMTMHQKCKIYSQLGQIIHQLSSLRFPKICSIFSVDHFLLGSVFVFKQWNTVEPIAVSYVDRSPLQRSITPCWPMYKLMKSGILICTSVSFSTVFRE